MNNYKSNILISALTLFLIYYNRLQVHLLPVYYSPGAFLFLCALFVYCFSLYIPDLCFTPKKDDKLNNYAIVL